MSINMKKLIILILAVSLVSCKKKHCYECKDGYKAPSFSTQEPIKWTNPYEKCGMTDDEISDYVRSQFMVITATSGYAGSRQTICTRK